MCLGDSCNNAVLETDKNKLLKIAEQELDASEFRQLTEAIKPYD